MNYANLNYIKTMIALSKKLTGEAIAIEMLVIARAGILIYYQLRKLGIILDKD